VTPEFWIGLVVNTVFGLVISTIAWQLKRGVEVRDKEIAELRRGQTEIRADRDADRRDLAGRCDARHGALDSRRLQEQEVHIQRYVELRVSIEKSMAAGIEKFATKKDLADMREEIRGDLHKLFAGQDQIGQRLAVMEGKS
jgi:hypothetical protein